ncbi:MAG: thiamine diphosphokinase [Treponemataceae bacterium]|nr:thiamine diphosphokinase [Treponemataceae bacterium]
MKSLICIGGQGPQKERCAPFIHGADLIIAADSGLSTALSLGLVPHWIIGDMDSLQEKQFLASFPPERVVRYPTDKDYTDTELACTFAWEQGAEELILLGGGEGRTDHSLALVSLFERPRHPDLWITAQEFIFVGDGKHPRHRRITLSFAENTVVSVFPLGTGPWRIKSRGLTWPVDNYPWQRGLFGISNRISQSPALLDVEEGLFLIFVIVPGL